MEVVLGHPTLGYYTSRDPLGLRGDFITAPEISQIFGELIGAWIAAVWQDMDTPDSIHLIEMGPGRGTLMSDALRVTKSIPGFHDALSIHLIEMSPVLRAKQAKALEKYTGTVGEPSWHRDLSQVPDGPAVVVANEFFDALPVRQFQRVLASWRERMVGLHDSKESLAFVLGEKPVKTHFIPESLRGAPDGAWAETSPTGLRIMHTLSNRLSAQGGAALIIDYGHTTSAPGETLQAVQGHRFTNVLAAPGEQDLTTHVDFAALGRVAKEAGAKVHGPVEQGAFLESLGLSARTRRLAVAANDDMQAVAVISGANRMTDSAQMGSLFKVIGVSAPGIKALPGLS